MINNPKVIFGFIAISTISFSPLTTAASTWAEGACNDSRNHGANREFYNAGASFKWNSYLGDWADRQDKMYGTEPFDSLLIEDKDDYQQKKFSLTELVSAWHIGQFSNQGVMLKNRNGSKVTIYSKEHGDINLRPSLEVITSAGTYTLTAIADTMLRSSTYKCAGDVELLNSTAPILMQFDLKNIPSEASIINATLNVHTTENQYGNAYIDAYRVAIKDRKYSGSSLAQAYPNDFELKYDPSSYLVETFDTNNWQGNWSYIWGNENMEVVTENSSDGFEPLMGAALKVTIPEGELSGINMAYLFEDKIGKDVEEVYFRYYLRLGDSWEVNDTGKLPGIAGTYAGQAYEGGWGGRTSNGSNGWSARGIFGLEIEGNNPLAGKTPIGNYIYHADQTHPYGDHVIYDGKQPGVIKKNQWYAIEQQVKMNTPGKQDGIFRAWINGELAYENTELRFRDENSNFIAIDRVWVNFYHGGITAINKTSNAYIDNLVISKEYVGPILRDSYLPDAGSEEGRPPVIESAYPVSNDIELPVNGSMTFEVEFSDPDSNNLDVNWYVNGELIDSGYSSFDYFRDISNVAEQLISVEVVDEEGKLSTHSWLINSEMQNWQLIEATDDSTIAQYTNDSQGYKNHLKVNSAAVAMLKFDLPDDFNVEDLKSAKLMLTDYEQFGNMQLQLFMGPNDWNEGSNSDTGASRHYKNHEAKVAWELVSSDWVDASNIIGGEDAFLTEFVTDINDVQKLELDVFDMLFDIDNNQITFVIKSVNGNHTIASRNHDIAAYHPILALEK